MVAWIRNSAAPREQIKQVEDDGPGNEILFGAHCTREIQDHPSVRDRNLVCARDPQEMG